MTDLLQYLADNHAPNNPYYNSVFDKITAEEVTTTEEIDKAIKDWRE